jgi:deazaflavin-dependent oxidoreductase (nitroreductase family)
VVVILRSRPDNQRVNARRRAARFNRVVTNRVQRLWAPHLPPWMLVVHHGRRTGREYRTPVLGTRRGGRVALSVLYGTDSDWVQNVLAAGRATVVHSDRSLRIDGVELVDSRDRDDLGWLGRAARHVVVGHITDGPGVHSFDPVRLGTREADAWVAYYRHDWQALLSASLALVDEGFGMGRARTVLGAWYVLRANQRWSPYPDNDPAAARAYMRRFYALVRKDGGLTIDPVEASRREVDWWRIHRIHQREDGISEAELTASVARLYSYVYSVPEAAAREAARLRVEAMRLSDEWVDAGCDLNSAILTAERSTLVDSYRALRAAVTTT